MRERLPYRSVVADKMLPHLVDPINAFTLAERAGSTFSGVESALRAMHRRGEVRKIVQRKDGKFIAHLWQVVSREEC